ncbi:hypothetical protein RchiOBHm_Chr4g0404701 [Rosa chinensis]|uniref:Uncharacterized protein n=1 Tax=Rosa chinensis TaxID=74649 RepID=A0A2P6QTW0_ROSCH|nr:uncharacterized protein LOC112199033 [Rosa chinensis]PRQ37623.1 hypothetical protein RchiOBHm_Chr4g0404701 [Rosa chinensis]
MLLHLGYCLLLIAFLVPYVQFLKPKFILSDCTILVLIEAALFQTYLAVVWNLALIVLKIEEKWDMEELGKAEQLIKRSKLRVFFLNILFRAFSVAVVYDLNKIGLKAFSGSEIIMPLLALNSMSLMRMLSLMVYSNQYYECKETHGEELELQGSMH